MRWTNGSYEIDDDRSRLDMDRIVAWLAESFGSSSRPAKVGGAKARLSATPPAASKARIRIPTVSSAK